jgi:hypothetical protein
MVPYVRRCYERDSSGVRASMICDEKDFFVDGDKPPTLMRPRSPALPLFRSRSRPRSVISENMNLFRVLSLSLSLGVLSTK